MPGLLDIAKPMDQFVPVRGTDVQCYGISSRGIALLLERFPLMRELIVGRAPKITAETIFKVAPDAVASIIVAGTMKDTELADADKRTAAEAVADSLYAEEQLDLLEKILGLTMPKGIGPFVERLMAMFEKDSNAGGARTNTAATK